jgi:UDPglucose--hexose-1-phosphate uridylyltransferase
MHKTSTQLADGRDLIYFDRRDIAREVLPDLRDLGRRPGASEPRFDLRTGDWVVVADHRQDRSFQPTASDCPLCATRPGRPTEVPAADYEVVVFENRFPALSTPSGLTGTERLGSPVVPPELLWAAAGGGRCEVICFSSQHDASFADLKPDQARLVLDAWADRTDDLSLRDGVAQVYCFENRGAEIGVTQPHPHGQIYAYPYLTPRTAHMLERARAYRSATGANLFDDLVAAEAAAERVVARNDEWIAFVPFAARWPYEVHAYPSRRRRDLTDLDDGERDAFVALYLDLLARFDRLFDAPAPYISAWHQAPRLEPGAAEFALHLELFTNRRSDTKLKVMAGTEAGMDSFSNDISPEKAADRLREIVG